MKLTPLQENVLKRMRAAGLEWVTEATQRAWQSGERYYIDDRCKASKRLRRDFDKANDAVEAPYA